HRAAVTQQVIRVHRVTFYQLDTLQVARAQVQVLLGLTDVLFHQQRRALRVQLVQRRAEGLRLGFFQLEVFDHHQLAVGELRRQRRAQRTLHFLAREVIVVGAGLGSMDRAAMPPQWGTDRRDTRPARALLLPQLLAGAAHQSAGLGGGGPGPQAGAVMLYRFPKQVFVDRAKYFVGQLQRAYFFAVQIHYINRRHNVFPISYQLPPNL